MDHYGSLWITDYGLWIMDYNINGLWIMDYGPFRRKFLIEAVSDTETKLDETLCPDYIYTVKWTC